MATINNWDPSKISDYSSIYPFVGTEVAWFVGAVLLWLFFHYLLFKFDKKDYEENISSS